MKVFLVHNWFPMKFVFRYHISWVWWEITFRKEYVMWMCFKFWPMKNLFKKLKANEDLIMAFLRIYQELLSLATILRVHSNSKEVSYLFWQSMYLNLKTTCHIKLKFFFWTKLLENLFFAKNLISVTASLMAITPCILIM